MSDPDLYLAVHWTARLSAVLFAVALIAPVLSAWRARALHVGFIAAHTIHFAFVAWLASSTGGANMFPGGRSIADVGGWPAVFGIFAFFELLAGTALIARLAGDRAGPALRVAGRLSTTFIGFMFVSTYVPLMDRSPWYALPASLVAAGVGVDLLGARIRRLRCPGAGPPLAPGSAPASSAAATSG